MNCHAISAAPATTQRVIGGVKPYVFDLTFWR